MNSAPRPAKINDSRTKAADHLREAARQVRRFGRDGEPVARELELLAEQLTTWTAGGVQ